MKIANMIAKKDSLLSFEFFPPKKVENEYILFETINELRPYKPDFVSITYGAGGSTRDKTLSWSIRLQKEYHLETMMHLTCISATNTEISLILSALMENGIENILALRGDMPKDSCHGHVQSDFKYAKDLVKVINNNGNFCIGVAGYPEGHIEAVNIEEDIRHLKEKIDAGASFIITQLFFENDHLYRYIDLLHKNGIFTPVLAGIMPITSCSQIDKFRQMCGVYIPGYLADRIGDKNDDEVLKIGVEYAVRQCEDLLKNKIKGLHFYTLNRSEATKMILNKLGKFNHEK
jgi:methylenetetrahydrofolate reductase (NADPH)